MKSSGFFGAMTSIDLILLNSSNGCSSSSNHSKISNKVKALIRTYCISLGKCIHTALGEIY